jgi:hypothetical protein
MPSLQRIGWGIVGAALTVAARKVTGTALHNPWGVPRFSRVTRENSSFGLMVALAVATGVLLALGDVMREHRKGVVDVAAG